MAEQRAALMQRHFVLRPSRILIFVIVFAHILVMGMLPFLAFPPWSIALLLLVLMFSMSYYVLRELRKVSYSAVAMRLEDDRIVLIDAKGIESLGKLRSGCLITPYLIVLNLEAASGRCQSGVLVLPDSMDAESFRRLRVALRWHEGFRI